MSFLVGFILGVVLCGCAFTYVLNSYFSSHEDYITYKEKMYVLVDKLDNFSGDTDKAL